MFVQGTTSRLSTRSSELGETQRWLAEAKEEARQLKASVVAARGNFWVKVLTLIHLFL